MLVIIRVHHTTRSCSITDQRVSQRHYKSGWCDVYDPLTFPQVPPAGHIFGFQWSWHSQWISMKDYQPFRSLRDRILNSLVILWLYHGATAGHVASVSGKNIYGFLNLYPTNFSDHLTFPFMASSGWHKYFVVQCLKNYWIGCPQIVIT